MYERNMIIFLSGFLLRNEREGRGSVRKRERERLRKIKTGKKGDRMRERKREEKERRQTEREREGGKEREIKNNIIISFFFVPFHTEFSFKVFHVILAIIKVTIKYVYYDNPHHITFHFIYYDSASRYTV